MKEKTLLEQEQRLPVIGFPDTEMRLLRRNLNRSNSVMQKVFLRDRLLFPRNPILRKIRYLLMTII